MDEKSLRRIDRVFGDRGRNVIYGAMKEWQEKTCIRFEPAGSAGTKNLGHRDNIRFVNGVGIRAFDRCCSG